MPDTLNFKSEVLSAGYSYHTKLLHQTRHKGRSYIFRLQTEGVCRALVRGRMELIKPGDILMCKTGSPYELLVDEELQISGETATLSGDYYLFCIGSWIDHWWERSEKPDKVKIPLHEGILGVWRQLNVEHAKHEGKSTEMIDYLLRIICLHIDRAIQEMCDFPQSSNSYVAHRMKHYIEENAAASALSLDQIAKFAGLSVSRAVHIYKEAFGQSMMQYAIDVRLNLAKERILYSPLTLEQVAESCGFASYSYFHRMFRARFGPSPKLFKKANLT